MSTLVTLEEQPLAAPAIIGAIAAGPKIVLPDLVITRPNNATQYAIGDVYGDAADARYHIDDVARLAGGMATLAAFLKMNSAQGTKPTFDFWMFDGQPATVIGDNAPLDGLSDADVGKIIGRATFTGSSGFPTTQPQAGKSRSVAVTNLLSAALLSGVDVWMYVVLGNTYTPVANETLTLQLTTQYVS